MIVKRLEARGEDGEAARWRGTAAALLDALKRERPFGDEEKLEEAFKAGMEEG